MKPFLFLNQFVGGRTNPFLATRLHSCSRSCFPLVVAAASWKDGQPPTNLLPSASSLSCNSPPWISTDSSGLKAKNLRHSSSKNSIQSRCSAVDSQYSRMKLCKRMQASIIWQLCANEHCRGRQRIPQRNSISPKAHSTAIRTKEWKKLN
jgi:hypothetical protein